MPTEGIVAAMAFRRGFTLSPVLMRALGLVLAARSMQAQPVDFSVHANVPGGNILVERIEGDSVFLRQDWRTSPSSFYWLFAVSGAAARTLEFRFTAGPVFGIRGPAVSCDAGQSWAWLGTNVCLGETFRYTFGQTDHEIRFGVAIPYVEQDLERFLSHYATNAALKVGSLGHTPEGHVAEWLRAGRLDGQAPHRILITCRHHPDETMANFVAEGLLQEVLNPAGAGPWFSENAEVCVAPFIDKDGVEAGNPGHRPVAQDPWFDYGDESHYTSVLALRARFDPRIGLPVRIALDFQCPGLHEDKIRLIPSPGSQFATNFDRFSQALEQEQQRQGSLIYHASDNLPFGYRSNQTNADESQPSFMHWAQTLQGIELIAAVQLPYAAVGTQEVTPDSARAFGQGLALAIRAQFTAAQEATVRARPGRPGRRQSYFDAAGRKPRTNNPATPSLVPAAPVPKRATNSWNRVLGDNALAGQPWVRHVIDNTSVGADGVKLADVDGDGRPDIITGWEEGGEVRLYFHPGDSQCREPWPRAVLGSVRSPEDAVLVDLDGDGHLDALSATQGNERTIYVHWASPELNPRQESGWETHPIPATRDQQMWMFLLPLQLDGQHGPDVVTGSKGDHGAIGWLQGPADARDLPAWKWHLLRPAGWVMSLRALDLDGDGDKDILFSDRKGPASGVGWLENPGPAAVARHEPWPEHWLGARGLEVMFLDVGDLAGDGSLTIAAAVKPAEILLLRRRDKNDWAEDWIHLETNCGHAKGVKMADFDRDGRMDLAFSCEGATGPLRGVIWLRREENGWRPYDLSGPAGTKFDLIETLDIDGDGDLDVLTTEETENLGVVWYENPTVRAAP